jgi:nucleoside-diphosphate-sugar epimerase
VSTTASGLVGITGSAGYLGGSLVEALRANEREVVSYQRRAGAGVSRLDLDQAVDPKLFEGVSCLVHGAWDLKETDPHRAWERNVDGSKRILDAALQAGVSRFIFISSMSAYFGTKQNYGLMKMAVERAVLEADQIVVRPGLVYGGETGGMARTLSNLARLPVIPVFKNARQFTLHIDDFLATMTSLIITDDVPSSVIGLGYDPPEEFRDIMMALARQQNRTPRTLTVPWAPLHLALVIAEKVGLPLPVRSDSLLGLVRPANSLPGKDVAARLGASFRRFGD